MTRGRLALLALLQRTQRRFVAARCGVAPSTVSRWASGETKPSIDARKRLAGVSGYRIPAEAWDDRHPSPKG